VLKNREQFSKLVLPCSLRSHRKTNPTPKMAAPYLALPARHPEENSNRKNEKQNTKKYG